MAGKVLKFTNGFPGAISRSIDDIVESLPNGEATAAIAFGAPVAFDGGKVVNVSASKYDIIGVAVRSIKTENTYGGDDANYKPKELVDVLKRGTIAMDAGTTTPTAGGAVYIVKATGKIATAADGSNTVATNWRFKGTKDDNNVVEVVLAERVF